LIGCPISRSLTTSCVCLELRSLPSTGVTRLQRYYEPLRHPRAPGLPSRASGWSSLTTLQGFPCCEPATTPVQRLGVLFAHSPSRISLPRKGRRIGLHIVLFEACSAFTRVAACTLALSPIRDTLIEGFSHFVTSMTAPIDSGWSGLPGGPCTHWKAPPSHGARQLPTLGCCWQASKRAFPSVPPMWRTRRTINGR